VPFLPRHPRPAAGRGGPTPGRHHGRDRLGVAGQRPRDGIPAIAAQLARPLSTVRRWIRAVRDPAHVEWLRTQGMVWLSRVDLDVINTLVPQATRLSDALTALAAAALTLRARVVPHVSPWTLVGQITHGRLVGPPVSARPG
jgi:hypothetical protein